MMTCRRQYLDGQLERVDPEVVVLMGAAAVRQMLGESGRMAELHGQVHRRDGRVYLVTYHPAAGMRFPHPGEAIRRDFDVLAQLMDARGARPPRGTRVALRGSTKSSMNVDPR